MIAMAPELQAFSLLSGHISKRCEIFATDSVGAHIVKGTRKNRSKLHGFFDFKRSNKNEENEKESKDKPKKLSDDILKCAHDPILFEKAVMEQRRKEEEEKQRKNSGIEDKPKKPYQRIEKWDEEKKVNMSWEERVQYEGQRYGNQINQNEILRKNLKGF